MRAVKKLYFVCLLITAAAAAGCGGSVKYDQPAETKMAKRQVTDDLGRQVTVPADIRRVVSLAPDLTEDVFAVGAGDRLVGVTTFCNFPEQAKAIQKVGDTMTPNMESIIALKPDVVLVSTASQIETFAKTLEQNNIAVYVTDPRSLDEMLRDLKQLGDLLGTRERADELVASLQQRIDAVTSSVPADDKQHQRVFVQVSREPLFTIGKQSFLTDLVARAGGRSVTADVDSAYPRLSKETAARLDPQVIILSESDDDLEPNEIFKSSPAVKNGRVYKINADILSRPGPRLIDALEQVAKSLGK